MSITRPPCDEGVIRAGAADTPCTPSARPWILVATILGSSLAFIDASTVNVALPALQASLGATVTEIQWVVNAYTLFLASLILLGGSLGDHYGRTRVFILGVGVFTLASVWCGFSPTANQLILARALQGIGGALLVPGSLAIISASFPETERGAAIGIWSGFSAITSAVGPVLGGWLIDTFSWRWIFFINVPLALIVIAVALWRVPESRDLEAKRLDVGGAALVTLGLGGLTYGLLEGSSRGFGDPWVLAALGLGVFALTLFVRLEARLSAPMVPLSLFRSRTFSGANLLTICLYGALSGALFFLPLNLIQIQGYSATAAGAALLPFVLLLSFLSRWSGGLVARLGAKLPLTAGPIIVALGFLLFMRPGIEASYWSGFFPAVVVLGLGMAISVAPLTTTVMNAVPAHYAGTASGINNAGSRAAGLMAIALFGILMLSVFSVQLRRELSQLELSPQTSEAVFSSRRDLAALTPPDTLTAEQQGAVERVVDTAYVTGFRVVMGVSAGLALVSALIAWKMIEGKATAKGRATETGEHLK